MSDTRTNKTNAKKAQMIEALEKSLGIVTTACESVGINRWTHYDWMKKDEDYKSSVEDIENRALDFAESHLHKLIESGNPAATIFFLKTRGKSRGYVETRDYNITTDTSKLPDWFDEKGEE